MARRGEHGLRASNLLTRARALLAVACATACVPLHAFEVVPTDLSPPPVDDHAPVLKWGPSAIAGTTGGVVTWGFVSEGTRGGRGCGEDDAAMGSSRVRHLLRPDDVAGVRFLYGAPRAADSVPR